MNTLRQELARLAEELRPGDELLAELLSNASDTQAQLAMEVLKRLAPQSSPITKEK